MKKTGEWGEFFPIKYSPFAYNESMANFNFPMSKDEILNNGLKFQENLQKTTNKTTIIKYHNIRYEVKNEILNEKLECIN